MEARQETEVVISPTIRSQLCNFILACPVTLRGGRAAGGRLGSNRPRRQYGATQEFRKTPSCWQQCAKGDLQLIFQQVRAKACAMDVRCLKVVARRPAGKEGRPGSARICNCVGSSAGQRWSLHRLSPPDDLTLCSAQTHLRTKKLENPERQVRAQGFPSFCFMSGGRPCGTLSGGWGHTASTDGDSIPVGGWGPYQFRLTTRC
jgi:hypothetical protein